MASIPLRPLFLSFLLGAVAVPAQTTWVYDSSGGGNFTNLQVAVDSVAAGDTILLRTNWFQFLRVKRSVRLVGDAAGVRLIIVEFRGLTGRIDCTLSGVTVSVIEVENATLRRGSRATFDTCQINGSVAGAYPGRVCLNVSSTPAVLLTGSSSAQFANCTLVGPGLGFLCLGPDPGRPGLVVDAGGTADLARTSVTSLGVGLPAISGTGTVRTDGAIIQPPFAGAVPAILPSTNGTGAAPGSVMQAYVEGQPGLPAVVVTSFGMRPPVLAPEGLVWIDLNAFIVLRIGLLDSTGRMNTMIALPPGVQRGLALTLQGAVALPSRPVLLAASPTILHVL